MKLKSRVAIGMVAAAAIAAIGVGSAHAATTIGTVTGKDGDTKDRISMNAEVVGSAGSHLTLKDIDTGKTYETGIGPSWHSGSYNVGDKLTVEGVETAGNNDNGHNFQAMKINDKVLRENFEGKPAWSGKRDKTMAADQGTRGQGRGANYIDADGDGECDNNK